MLANLLKSRAARQTVRTTRRPCLVGETFGPLEARITPDAFYWAGGAGDNNWTTPGNWWRSPIGPPNLWNRFPGAGDSVSFQAIAGGSNPSVVNQAFTVSSLSIDPTYTSTLTLSNP